MSNLQSKVPKLHGYIFVYKFLNCGVSFYGMISTYFILKATTISFFFHFSHFTFFWKVAFLDVLIFLCICNFLAILLSVLCMILMVGWAAATLNTVPPESHPTSLSCKLQALSLAAAKKLRPQGNERASQNRKY